MMSGIRRCLWFTFAIAVAALAHDLGSPPAAALAQGDSATAHVLVTGRAGTSADAQVTLTAERGGGTFTCRTRAGSCDIQRIPPGRYVVTAVPTGEGRPPLPRVVPVPAHVPQLEVRIRLL